MKDIKPKTWRIPQFKEFLEANKLTSSEYAFVRQKLESFLKQIENQAKEQQKQSATNQFIIGQLRKQVGEYGKTKELVQF